MYAVGDDLQLVLHCLRAQFCLFEFRPEKEKRGFR